RYYTELKETYGHPLEVFEHNSIINESEPGIIISIMTGLSYPATRIEDIADSLNSIQESITLKAKDNLEEIKTSLSWLDESDDASTIDGDSTASNGDDDLE